MNLIRLYIKEHLLLRDLDIRFDRSGRLDEKEEYRLDFLVGVNGSGKSTLLRTLVEILVSLQTGAGAQYAYILEYELKNDGLPLKVSIDKHWDSDKGIWHVVTTVVSSDGISVESYNTVLDPQYLPERIVVYTTGSETEWERLLDENYSSSFSPEVEPEIFQDPVKRAIHELPGHTIGLIEAVDRIREGEPPFFLIHGSRLNATTLCGLLRYLSEADNTTKKPLANVLEAIGIEGLPGFSLRFNIFERLSAKSTYNELLELLPIEIRQGSSRLLVFNLDGENNTALRILEKAGGAFSLFTKLDSLQEDDLTDSPTLQEINLFLQKKKPVQSEEDQKKADEIPDIFLLDWLSDGERAFLGRMALLAMLDMQDSLIILDEPEVHFNDYWKREIIQFLNTFIKGYSNQILLTTHSTIVMSDITANQVHLFVKGEDGKTQVIETHSPLFGADPSFVMTNLLGTGRPGGTYSKKYLEDALLRNNKEELRDLMNLVGPGYWRLRIDEQLGGEDDISNNNS